MLPLVDVLGNFDLKIIAKEVETFEFVLT